MEALAPRQEAAPARIGLDHVTLAVSDYAAAKRFYARTLRTLGLVLRLDWPDRLRAYFGAPGDLSCIWIAEAEARGPVELSFAAPDRETVDAFHAVALAGGARSRRAPGVQPDYTMHAYAAVVEDADGNVLEAVAR
jgi:catechol 2,3-dioxygenase-like lactoylglutathione lyase family enzyme